MKKTFLGNIYDVKIWRLFEHTPRGARISFFVTDENDRVIFNCKTEDAARDYAKRRAGYPV